MFTSIWSCSIVLLKRLIVSSFLRFSEAVVRRCFVRKSVLRNFSKFTWKHLCQSLFFSKVAGLGPATLLKKRFWHRCFSLNFEKCLRTRFLIEHLRWLLLKAYGNILQHLLMQLYLNRTGCSPVNFLDLFKTSFLRTSLKVCFCQCRFNFRKNTYDKSFDFIAPLLQFL